MSYLDITTIIIITLLITAAVWLWRLCKTQLVNLSLDTQLFPRTRVTVSPKPKLNLSNIRISITGSLECKVEPTKKITYCGEAELPGKVYEGDSHNISIHLMRNFAVSDFGDGIKVRETSSGKEILVQIQRDSSLEQFLEIELQAAGLMVDGEKKATPIIKFRRIVL